MLYVRRSAIRWALRRPAPNRIPLSGPRLSGRDYYSAYLGDNGDAWRFLVQSVEKQGLGGFWFDAAGQPGVPTSVPNSSISGYRIEIVRYITDLEIRYSSAFEFLLHQFLFLPWIYVWRERLQRRAFNRTKLVRKDRIGVLQIFLSKTLEQHDFCTSSAGLMSILYSQRWVHHPDNEHLHQYYRLLLDSLVESGDMTKQDIAYRLAPGALSTLARFEDDDRRHHDAARLQTAIIILTAALVVVGVIQAIVTYLAIPPMAAP